MIRRAWRIRRRRRAVLRALQRRAELERSEGVATAAAWLAQLEPPPPIVPALPGPRAVSE